MLGIRDVVEAMIEKQEEAWKNHDVEGIVDGLTDDGICMLPGMDVAKGKEGILIHFLYNMTCIVATNILL